MTISDQLMPGEALTAGLHVAEFFDGDTLHRAYGETADKARAELLAVLAGFVTIIAPELSDPARIIR